MAFRSDMINWLGSLSYLLRRQVKVVAHVLDVPGQRLCRSHVCCPLLLCILVCKFHWAELQSYEASACLEPSGNQTISPSSSVPAPPSCRGASSERNSSFTSIRTRISTQVMHSGYRWTHVVIHIAIARPTAALRSLLSLLGCHCRQFV